MTDRNALNYYDAGYRALVSVVPPNGQVASHSAVSQKDAGKVPGRKNAHGEYVGYNWMTHQPERHEVHQWLLDGSNVGMGAWAFPAIDIDVMDKAMAQKAIAAVEEIMGPCVVRRGRFPKALLIFRCEEPLKSFDVRYEGEHPLLGRVRHLIQFLGQGRQYVIDGIHPDTLQPYTIEDPLRAFGLLGAQALPLLTPEKVAECFDAIARVYAEAGFQANTDANARLTALDVPQDSLKAPDMATLAATVATLPNHTPDRDEYVAVGYAIKGASQDDPAAGLDIFQEWGSRWDLGPNDPAQVEMDWNKMVPPFRTGYDWLLDRGRKWGVNMAAFDFGQAEAPPAEAPPAAPDLSAPPEPKPTPFFTEIDLADEFIQIYAGRVLTVPDLDDATYTWTGTSWEKHDRHYVRQEVREFIKRKAKMIPVLVEGDTKQAETRGRVMRNATIANVTQQVTFSRELSVGVDEMDSDPDILNTPAGPYCLRTGQALTPDPSKPLLRRTAVSPDPDARCPRWMQFIKEVTEGDPSLMHYLQKLAGYALTGHTREQVFPFFLGSGGNGKSKFIDILMKAWGDYGASVPVELFQARKTGGGDATQAYYLADLVGARLVTTSETKTGGYWDEHRVKQLTGEDMVHGRMPYGRPFLFEMRATLIVVGNYAPELESVGPAMARRLHLVPWNFAPTVVDDMLTEKLVAELPGILAWAVEGAGMWYREGLQRPASVAYETTSYLDEQDAFKNWMEECVVVDIVAARSGQQFVSTQALHESYCKWKAQNHGRPMGYPKFNQLVAPRMTNCGARKTQDAASRKRGWLGVQINEASVLPPNVSRFPGAEPPPVPVGNAQIQG